jgi:hypothetical protein
VNETGAHETTAAIADAGDEAVYVIDGGTLAWRGVNA